MHLSPSYILLSLSFVGFYYETFQPNLIGSSWLVVFLITDSLTSITQETIFKKYKVNGLTMMYYINLYSVLALMPSMYNQMFELITRETFLYTILLSTFVSCSQYFALEIIKHYGAITYVVVCTYRSLLMVMPMTDRWVYFAVIFVLGITVYRHNHVRSITSS